MPWLSQLLDARRARRVVRVASLPMVGAIFLSADASYGVRTVTAFAAAAVFLRTALCGRDSLWWSRLLFAGALLVGVGSGIASAVSLAMAGHTPPIGSFSDWLYLTYAPLGAAAVLSVPRSSRSGAGTVRSIADGVAAAASLWYVIVALFVGPTHLGDDLGTLARGVTLAFPLLPVFVIAVIISVLPQVKSQARPFLLRGGVALLFLGTGDVAVAVASWDGWYRPDSWIAAISQLGLIAMLDAALTTPAASAADVGDNESGAGAAGAQACVAATVPYVPLLTALSVLSWQFVRGDGISHGQLAPVIVLGLALVVRYIAGARETGELVAELAGRERLARAQAMSDPLTLLANRTAFLERLEEALLDPGLHQVAVAMLDLNDFKDVNDTHGHDTGDEVLRHTAVRLENAMPEGCVARLGGDEFAIFVPQAADGGHALARRISEALVDPVRVGSRPFLIRASVGVVVDERAPGRSRRRDAAHLLAHADVAMYEAKRTKHLHGVPVVVLTGKARATAAATIRIREEISLPNLSQFRVLYQPVVDLHSGAIVAAEALLRWTHPDLGEISPATFIPLAERVGSVGVLGDFVLRVALDDLASWTANSDSKFAVGVNVSPRQLADSTLAEKATAMLAARGLHPRQLSFELTEEAFADDIESIVETIAGLRAAGLWVAVDDFGTGYSSLSYLRRFDANIVKIDAEFVQACVVEPRTDALVRSVLGMATALDLQCVAEGIESFEQLARLRSNGCHLGQGFLLARPMPTGELQELIKTNHRYAVNVETLPVQRRFSDQRQFG